MSNHIRREESLGDTFSMTTIPCIRIGDVKLLENVPPNAKLFTPKTGHVWKRTDRKSPKIEGTGGMYSHLSDFLELEGEVLLIWMPNDTDEDEENR